MALPAATVWEVRPGAGVDTNGGGFVTGSSGTDWSQQNAAQYALTLLTSAGAGNTLLSAAAAADMVGNIAQAISGTNITPGFFEVVSVVVGVSITFSTNNTGASIATGVAAAGVVNIGGALATISQAAASTNAVPNNLIWVKNTGTYTVTAALTISLDSSGAPGNPLSFFGYTTTRGDNGQVTWTTATNSIDLVDFTAARNVLFQTIVMTSTAGTPGAAIQAKTTAQAQMIFLINCNLSGFSVALLGNWNVNWEFFGLYLYNSRITACTSHAIQNTGSTYLLGCMIDNNGGDGGRWESGTPASQSNWIVESCIIYKNGANGLNTNFSDSGGATQPTMVVSHCDVSTNTLAGVLFPSSNNCPLLQVSNSILDANGTFGVDCGTTSVTNQNVLGFNNAFFNNTSGATRHTNAGIGTVTLTANPYTSIGTDFSLNNTAGGGAACKGAAFPGALTNGGGTGHADIGALQTAAGGSTTTIVVAPTQNNFFQSERG